MELVTLGSLRAEQLVWRPAHGGFVLTVVCKATFALRPGVSPLSPSQQAVAAADVYTEDGGALQVASDLVPLKKQPEVILTGQAYAPEGKRAQSFTVRLVVGEIDKAVRVEGDRSFGLDGQLTDPAPFVRMPLLWQRAAGGPDTSNPAGRAIGSSARPDVYGRVLAPSLLPPDFHLRSRGDIVPTVGFGPIAPLWPSRALCLNRHVAGWDPARWHERPLPGDIDLAYFNAAPVDQRRAAPFGEEQILLENLHPLFGQLATRLAPVTPSATVERGQGIEPLQLRCDTLLIDSDRGLAMLVWRGHVVLDHPDRPGRIVVTHAEAGEAKVSSRPASPALFDHTQAADVLAQASSALPFSDVAGGGSGGSGAGAAGAAGAAAVATTAAEPGENTLLSGATLAVDAMFGSTMAFGFANAAPAMPFPVSGDSAPPREAPPGEGGAGLPFLPAGSAASAAPTSVPPPPTGPLAVSLSAVFAPQMAPFPDSPGAAPAPVVPLAAWQAPMVPLAVSPPPMLGLPASPVTDSPVPPPMLGTALRADTAAAEPAEGEPLAAAPEDPFAAFPVERCAAVTASIARRRAETAQILEENELDPAGWEVLEQRWKVAIAEAAERGDTELLGAFDEAYVAQLERERGPITLAEYAGLIVATERGKLPEMLADMTLPRGAMMRIERVWLKRALDDEALEKSVRKAVKAARGK